MPNALEEHDGKVSINSRNIIDLQFVDDIDAVAEIEQEQEAQLKVSTKPAQGMMEISAEKTKLMTNSPNDI